MRNEHVDSIPMSPKRRDGPRPVRPEHVPLDDGSRYGTDPWREIDGVSFCHWDRWLLRLALGEPDGLRSIAATLTQRARGRIRTDSTAEALLAQVVDLQARLSAVQRAPADVLDDIERASKWLLDKASRRVWDPHSVRCTEAMLRTPRNVLAARARDGHWSAFPISPAHSVSQLASIYATPSYDHRATHLAVRAFELRTVVMLTTANTDDERLAVRRGIVGACIEAMAQLDDSGDELGAFFREQEEAYFALLAGYVDRPDVIQDLLELAVWEDYGLFRRVESFLAALPAVARDVLDVQLKELVAELADAGLAYQAKKAERLRVPDGILQR